MSLPPIAALQYYNLPQSLTLPPITNSPSTSSSPPVKTPRTNSSPQSSTGWYSASPSSRPSKSNRQSLTLPSFRDAFPGIDNDVLPVFRPKPLVAHPAVFFSDSEEEYGEHPKSLIYDDEEDKFTPRRGARSTFFDVSSERGQAPSESRLWQQSRLLKRVSAPSDALPTVAPPTLPPRNHSEPAPTQSGFFPPAAPSSPVRSTPENPVPEATIPPSSPPPSSPVLSQVTPTSPPLSPVSVSSASTLLRTVSPLTLPPSSPKISSSTDSEWEVEIKVEVCTPMTSEHKLAVAETATPRVLSPSPPSDELDTTIRREPSPDAVDDQLSVPLRPSTPPSEPSDLATTTETIQEQPPLTTADPGTPSPSAPVAKERSEISVDLPPTSVSASDDEPKSSSPSVKRKEEESHAEESESDQPLKKKMRRGSVEPPPKRRRRTKKGHGTTRGRQRYKSAPMIHDEDDEDDGHKEEKVESKPIKPVVHRRRRSSVTSIASCSSLSSVEDDPKPPQSADVSPKIPSNPKRCKPCLNPEMMGLVIECFATSRASSLAPSTIYRTLTASRPQLKAEKSKEEWLEVILAVLEEGWDGNKGVFGRVESSGKDDADKPLEARWFYSPENDYDQDRAALVKSMMPRPAKRSVTKRYKQYYYQPLGKMSRWDPEDAL